VHHPTALVSTYKSDARQTACKKVLLMTEKRSGLAALPAAQRSALTNNPLWVCGLDGRSAEARRYRDLLRAYSSPLGGLEALGAIDLALVRQAASTSLLSEAQAASLARGESVDAEQAVRVANTLAKLLRQLERRAAALKPRKPTLSEYLAATKEAK
jgi:hypothetical protein